MIDQEWLDAALRRIGEGVDAEIYSYGLAWEFESDWRRQKAMWDDSLKLRAYSDRKRDWQKATIKRLLQIKPANVSALMRRFGWSRNAINALKREPRVVEVPLSEWPTKHGIVH